MIRLMADTVNPSAPPGYDLYAGYLDGAPSLRSFVPLSRQYPGRTMSITVVGNAAADVCDVETGDVTPAHSPTWVKSKGSKRYGLWVAAYSVRSCPTPGAVAWQRQNHGPHGENIDVSEVYDVTFGPQPILPVIYCPASWAGDVVGACQAAGLTFVPAFTSGPIPPPPPPAPSSFPRNKRNAGNPTRSVHHA